MNSALASRLRPAAVPHPVNNLYAPDQVERLLQLIRREGPWKLILALHFKTAEEVMATLSGDFGDKVALESFLTPTFRGMLAQNGVCYYSQIEDIFHDRKALDLVREYWGAKIAQPTMMMFNIQGSVETLDPAHLDSQSYRGISRANSPTWLMATMAKSSLFERWALKRWA